MGDTENTPGILCSIHNAEDRAHCLTDFPWSDLCNMTRWVRVWSDATPEGVFPELYGDGIVMLNDYFGSSPVQWRWTEFGLDWSRMHTLDIIPVMATPDDHSGIDIELRLLRADPLAFPTGAQEEVWSGQFAYISKKGALTLPFCQVVVGPQCQANGPINIEVWHSLCGEPDEGPIKPFAT